MHELGIVFSIIDDVKAIAEQNKVKKILSVTMEIGEVSGVIPSYLIDCWTWAVKKEPILEGAPLVCEKHTATTHCNHCQKDYSTVDHGKICPFCQSEDTVLKEGNEILIKDIEVATS